jgi:nitroreductase
MPEDIGLFEAMYSQRAIRRFAPDPVPTEVLEKILEAGTKAPSGANSQPWAFVVVRDRDKREQLGAIAKRNFDRVYAGALASQQPGDPPPMPNLRAMVESIHTIPVWIVVCLVPPVGAAISADLYGSIFPAVQNILLAARGLGVGATLTTLLAGPELPALKATLDIPDDVEPLAFIPIGYPGDGAHYGPTTRRPLAEVLHWDSWATDKSNSAAVAYRTGP